MNAIMNARRPIPVSIKYNFKYILIAKLWEVLWQKSS